MPNKTTCVFQLWFGNIFTLDIICENWMGLHHPTAGVYMFNFHVSRAGTSVRLPWSASQRVGKRQLEAKRALVSAYTIWRVALDVLRAWNWSFNNEESKKEAILIQLSGRFTLAWWVEQSQSGSEKKHGAKLGKESANRIWRKWKLSLKCLGWKKSD